MKITDSAENSWVVDMIKSKYFFDKTHFGTQSGLLYTCQNKVGFEKRR